MLCNIYNPHLVFLHVCSHIYLIINWIQWAAFVCFWFYVLFCSLSSCCWNWRPWFVRFFLSASVHGLEFCCTIPDHPACFVSWFKKNHPSADVNCCLFPHDCRPCLDYLIDTSFLSPLYLWTAASYVFMFDCTEWTVESVCEGFGRTQRSYIQLKIMVVLSFSLIFIIIITLFTGILPLKWLQLIGYQGSCFDQFEIMWPVRL